MIINKRNVIISLLILSSLIFIIVFNTDNYLIGEKIFDLKGYLKQENNQPLITKQFLVDTPNCKIPDYDPFDNSLLKFIKKPGKIKCILPLNGVTTTKKNILYFNPQKFPVKFHSQYAKNRKAFPSFRVLETEDHMFNESNRMNCCYHEITRVTQKWDSKNSKCDKKWKKSNKCYPIVQEKTAIIFEIILVICRSSKKKIHYTNLHNFIQKDKLKNLPKPEKNLLSVIIFGTDSVSRLNLIRHLPKTYEYLKTKLKALEFVGYNKIADNTYPNMLATLLGSSKEEIDKNSSCNAFKPKVYDKCPFIWKKFKEKGAITAYAEDASWMGMFHYLKPGFVHPPTDYYGRPYVMAYENLMQNKQTKCLGNSLTIEVIHRYSLDFLEAFPNRPTFSLFWTAAITHDSVNLAGLADKPHLKYLQTLEERGTLNKSILIFMSDHGIRFGDIRKTYIGAMEERLPYLFIVFPEWFKKMYPSAFSNLQRNTKLLTCNYDVHKLMLDVAELRYMNKSYVTSMANNKSRGISLFKKIPVTRTCEEAGIPDHFCTCHQRLATDNKNELVIEAAKFVRKTINMELQKFKDKCITMKKVTVLQNYFLKKTTQKLEDVLKKEASKFFLVQLKLNPGGAIVEATVRVEITKRGTKSFQLAGEISRLDMYKNQSHCITDDTLRKFCICKDIIK